MKTTLFIALNLAAIVGWLQTRWPWWRFAGAQWFQLEAMIVGWFLLAPFCWARMWRPVTSTLDPKRTIDEWSWRIIGFAFNNPEDGVSGQRALVWTPDGRQVPYMPNASAPWRAYRWSALRNSCDNLKYVFRWQGGPFKRFEWRGYHLQLGFNSSGFPVISIGR